MRVFLAMSVAVGVLTPALAGDQAPNINIKGVQNIASMTQVGLLNFQILAQGQMATIAAPQTGAYLNIEQALVNLAPNSTAVIAILNSNTTINATNTIDAPVDISIVNSID